MLPKKSKKVSTTTTAALATSATSTSIPIVTPKKIQTKRGVAKKLTEDEDELVVGSVPGTKVRYNGKIEDYPIDQGESTSSLHNSRVPETTEEDYMSTLQLPEVVGSSPSSFISGLFKLRLEAMSKSRGDKPQGDDTVTSSSFTSITGSKDNRSYSFPSSTTVDDNDSDLLATRTISKLSQKGFSSDDEETGTSSGNRRSESLTEEEVTLAGQSGVTEDADLFSVFTDFEL